MEKDITCQEKIGLFLVDTCTNDAVCTCSNCGKKVCKNHVFQHKLSSALNELCLTCKAVLDPRITSQIELYSSDRAIWRKKMNTRFHEEYPYLVAMADQYDSLFDTVIFAGSNDSTNSSSSFES
ncbi:hypothetical protein [Riemerella anatipestifer]|uniref:hypothetical protein n=1 Tax=Riemerella anatipestifer TaxID=34085 RepID=UPI00129E07E4|nr:hypothetical protein [Riemerella anatipestifer]MRM82346.1 hypothetical protein [Riemerella anatipestifer]